MSETPKPLRALVEKLRGGKYSSTFGRDPSYWDGKVAANYETADALEAALNHWEAQLGTIPADTIRIAWERKRQQAIDNIRKAEALLNQKSTDK